MLDAAALTDSELDAALVPLPWERAADTFGCLVGLVAGAALVGTAAWFGGTSGAAKALIGSVGVAMVVTHLVGLRRAPFARELAHRCGYSDIARYAAEAQQGSLVMTVRSLPHGGVRLVRVSFAQGQVEVCQARASEGRMRLFRERRPLSEAHLARLRELLQHPEPLERLESRVLDGRPCAIALVDADVTTGACNLSGLSEEQRKTFTARLALAALEASGS